MCEKVYQPLTFFCFPSDIVNHFRFQIQEIDRPTVSIFKAPCDPGAPSPPRASRYCDSLPEPRTRACGAASSVCVDHLCEEENLKLQLSQLEKMADYVRCRHLTCCFLRW